MSRAETQAVKETLAERDERIRRLERLADEYRSLRAQMDLLQTRVIIIVITRAIFMFVKSSATITSFKAHLKENELFAVAYDTI